jgi:prepilin-type processing-associated H-X9-DG protein/prepilin-type N-terminal cleavage/methylation domain-containing protein
LIFKRVRDVQKKSHRFITFGAFSLLELLIVITIIAVLAALLMPTISMAKEQAKSTQCMSNLHQLYLGIAMYGGDRGRYPYSWDGAGVSEWTYQLKPYLGINDGDTTYASGDGSRSRVLQCPSRGRATAANTVKNQYSISLQLVGQYNFTDSFYPRKFPYDSNRATELVMLADGCQAGSNNCESDFWGHAEWRLAYDPTTAENLIAPYVDSDTISGAPGGQGKLRFRHKGSERANFLFVDGHIESMAKSQFKEKNLKFDAPIHP